MMPCLFACFSISSASFNESKLSITSTFPTIYFTLFVCRCPIMCQVYFGSYLSINSCTRFSPKVVRPIFATSSISSFVRVLDTATTLKSCAFSSSINSLFILKQSFQYQSNYNQRKKRSNICF